MLVNDPDVAQRLDLERHASGAGWFHEVRDGVYVLSSLARACY